MGMFRPTCSLTVGTGGRRAIPLPRVGTGCDRNSSAVMSATDKAPLDEIERRVDDLERLLVEMLDAAAEAEKQYRDPKRFYRWGAVLAESVTTLQHQAALLRTGAEEGSASRRHNSRS